VSSKVVATALRGAASSVATQGLGLATSLQGRFDWAGVATAGANSAAGYWASNKLGLNGFADEVVPGMAGGFAASAAESLVTGRDFGDTLTANLPGIIGYTVGNLIASSIEQAIYPSAGSGQTDGGIPTPGSGATGGASAIGGALISPDGGSAGQNTGDAAANEIVVVATPQAKWDEAHVSDFDFSFIESATHHLGWDAATENAHVHAVAIGAESPYALTGPAPDPGAVGDGGPVFNALFDTVITAGAGGLFHVGEVALARGASFFTTEVAESSGEFVGPLIGRSGFQTTSELSDAIGVRYQTFVDEGHGLALDAEANGLLHGNPNTRIGDFVDRYSAQGIREWLDAEGIAEGPNSMVQMNRWLRDPSGSGLYVRPDVRIPGAGSIFDATVDFKSYDATQIVRFGQYSGGDTITIVRPDSVGGSYSIVP
jgi:hypothetical protein